MQARTAIALFVLGVLLHWPLGPADFVYDDVDFVVKNASIRSFDAAAAAIQAPFPPDQPERGLYRPLTTALYALEYALWGADPRGYHVFSSLLYGGLVVLVYALGCIWFGRGSATAAAAATSSMASVVPGAMGTPAFSIISRASVLSPIDRMASGGGPMNVRPASAQASAKLAFSDRKP